MTDPAILALAKAVREEIAEAIIGNDLFWPYFDKYLAGLVDEIERDPVEIIPSADGKHRAVIFLFGDTNFRANVRIDMHPQGYSREDTIENIAGYRRLAADLTAEADAAQDYLNSRS